MGIDNVSGLRGGIARRLPRKRSRAASKTKKR